MSQSDEKTIALAQEPVESAQRGEVLAHGRVDVAAGFLSELDPSVVQMPISSEESRRVLWKIDCILIPLIMVGVVLAASDKVIISSAYVYGMKQDAHLTSHQYSWVGSIFYFGYLVFEYPAALLIQRLPVAKLYAACIMGWAIVLLCTAAAQNFAGLASVRFIMGALESVVFPISSIITVMWWTTKEQPIRVAFYFNQLSSVFTGIVGFAVGHSGTELAPWRLLFLVFGAASVVWAVIVWLFLPDSPMKARQFTDREKYVALQRVCDNNTGVEEKKIKFDQVLECLTDVKVWLLFVFSLAQNIPNGGLVTFSALVVSGLGYSPLVTTLLGIPTGVLATVWQISLSTLASRSRNKRAIIIAVANLVPMTCAILMWRLPKDNKHGRLAAYYVFYTYWGPYVLSTSLPMANVSGHTKKVTMNAMFFVAYCVGNIIGPQLFKTSEAPDYPTGYIGLLISLAIAIIAISLYGIVCKWDNAKRDKHQEMGGGVRSSPITDAFSDETDKNKPDFRYTY